jgi:hypothetical protein
LYQSEQIFAGAGHARDQWGFSRAWSAPSAIHSERYFDNQYIIEYEIARNKKALR